MKVAETLRLSTAGRNFRSVNAELLLCILVSLCSDTISPILAAAVTNRRGRYLALNRLAQLLRLPKNVLVKLNV